MTQQYSLVNWLFMTKLYTKFKKITFEFFCTLYYREFFFVTFWLSAMRLIVKQIWKSGRSGRNN